MKVEIGNYRKNRKIKIKIDDFDLWNMDHTLACIIHPMLLKMKESKHGSPCVSNEDVPEELHGFQDENGHDSMVHEKWDWILDQMIYSFQEILNDDGEEQFFKNGFDRDGYHLYESKIENGLLLFGKHFRALWT